MRKISKVVISSVLAVSMASMPVMATDINTLYNPYHKHLKNGKEVVEPATARPYLDRSKHHAYMIRKGDLCYRLFKEKGFRWGGDWKHSKDYQHFEK